MIEIIPAILPKSLKELERGLERLKSVAPLVQIDLVGTNVLEGQEALPLWDEFDFEFDIMLPNPAREVESAVMLGASRIVVHAEAKTAREALEFLQNRRKGDYAIAVGVALASHDEPEALKNFEDLFDYVQVMGIDHVGKQGEPPDPHHEELDLVRKLRAAFPDLIIQVDGAAAAHPQELAKAGANRLVVGSAVMTADNPKAALEALYTKVNS